MDSNSFIRSLQFTDSFFPVGAFAYSDGLETATSGGRIRDAVSLGEWMEHFLEGVFVPCEGLAVVKSMNALQAGDLQMLSHVDEELTAIRTSRAVRAASAGVGKRLLSLYAATHSEEGSSWNCLTLPHGNAAVAYAIVFFRSGLETRHAALAFGYNRLAGIVSAGLRLISVGQQQGQALLTKMLDRLPEAVDRIHEMADEPLCSFSPVLDIQQMNHQYVYSRLFRS
jgi:urease accessory protein